MKDTIRRLGIFINSQPDLEDNMKAIIEELLHEPDFFYMALTFQRTSETLGTKIYGKYERKIIVERKKIRD